MNFILGREMVYNLFQTFNVRHEGFSFYGATKYDKGADTSDLIYGFCWPKVDIDAKSIHNFSNAQDLFSRLPIQRLSSAPTLVMIGYKI